MEKVGAALGAKDSVRTKVQGLKKRVDRIVRQEKTPGPKPRVAAIEWIDPLMAAGNWIPELIEMAGGINLFGQAGKHSPWMLLN